MSIDQPGAMNELEIEKGLHVVQTQFQKRFMAEQCIALIENMDQAIEKTKEKYITRTRWNLVPHEGSRERPVSRPEDVLERGLFRRHSEPKPDSNTEYFQWLVAYQVSLAETRDSGWGEIDLLGVRKDGYPVPIELKAGTSNNTPASLITQAVGYGVAVQKAWSSGLRGEWTKAIEGALGGMTELPERLESCPVVCIAPARYWDQWTSVYRTKWRVALTDLRSAFSDRGFPVALVSVAEVGERYTFESVDLATWG